MADYDLLGSIAIIKGENKGKNKTKAQKLKEAKKLLKRPNVKTVLEKIGNVKGRLRTIGVRHVLGEKNLISEVKENDCRFKLNVKTCYFSPRLSNERKMIAEKIKKKDRVLVMFAGVGVYPIVVYKIKKPKEIIGVELGKECCKYFKENLILNKIPFGIQIIQGDVKKVIKKGGLIVKGNLVPLQLDVVLMPRPNLKESFLKSALLVSKKGTRIYYNGFCNVSEIKDLTVSLVEEALELGRKIKIMKVVKAGDIAPYKFRYRIEIRVKN